MRGFILIMIGFAVSVAGCRKNDSVDPKSKSEAFSIRRPEIGLDPTEAKIFKTNADEELVLDLAPRFKRLAAKLRGEPVDLSPLFTKSVQYLGPDTFDLESAAASQSFSNRQLVAHFKWPSLESPIETSQIDAEFWAPLIPKYEFEDTQFGVESGVLSEDDDTFHMKTVFEGRFRDDQNRVYGVKAKQTLDWKPVDGQWKISNWQQDQLKITLAPRTLFENTTAQAFSDKKVRDILTDSIHQQMMFSRAKDRNFLMGFSPIVQYFIDWNSLFQYTSVSVVDLDQDQWDDLFVMDRWGESVLLRNRGDGTYEDVSRTCGLKLKETVSNCALFADFDNDGDSDVLIGRTLQPSLYYRNDGGKFVPDAETNRILSMVRFVSSGSLVDVNRDGLLDVYLSTYCTRGGSQLDWIQYAVPPAEQGLLGEMITSSHSFLDRRGPPNILLMNHGGKLKLAPINDTLKQWRVSFQSAWTDIDDDGDQDLYLCNDFAPDVFLRNDTERLSFTPKFTDITAQVFEGGTMGFGMGASFGDYDSDGKLDLYVSNMYSKAGHRVIDQIGSDVDPRIAVSARGNFLYRNTGGKFEQVAGLEPGKQHVSKVGWSFGGQMADFNNDGRLDVYVPSGFFTAPESIAGDVDL